MIAAGAIATAIMAIVIGVTATTTAATTGDPTSMSARVGIDIIIATAGVIIATTGDKWGKAARGFAIRLRAAVLPLQPIPQQLNAALSHVHGVMLREPERVGILFGRTCTRH